MLKHLKRLMPLLTALLFGCATPRSEDVVGGAERYLKERFGRPYQVFEAKSTFNEGNFNPKGFRIAAAPRQELRELITFDADYIDGAITPTGMNLQKLVDIAGRRLALSLDLAARLRPVFPRSRAAVLPNSLYEEKVSVEIELYRLPADARQEQIFGEAARILGAFLPGLDFQTLNLEITFLSPEWYTPRKDGLLERYFEHNSAAWKRRRAHLYAVNIREHPVAAPPTPAELAAALHVNGNASLIQSARYEAQRWLEDDLKAQGVTPLHIGINRIYPEIAGAYDELRFEFANCQIKRHPKNCPAEQKTVYRVLYRLEDKHISRIP